MSKQTAKGKIRSAYRWGKDHNSCALEWRKTLGPDATQADAYRLCERGDWIIWQLSKLTEDEFNSIRPQLEKAIEKIVTRAVKNYALNCGIDFVEKWARNWLDNIDRSEGVAREAAARAAAMRVGVGAVRKAAWAARKAAVKEALAAAEWAASAAAEKATENKLQADDIREFIPQWPGSC